jgi:hypothetical protein
MSIRAAFTLGRISLLGACLLLGAAIRVWAAGGVPGELGVIKLLSVPLGMTAAAGAISYRLVPTTDLPDIAVGLCRLAFIVGIFAVGICLFGTVIFGIPFVAHMLREQ